MNIIKNGRDGMVVGIGEKNKHVRIPIGWYVVTFGTCQEGDMFLNLGKLPTVCFHYVDEDDVGLVYDDFECLIRKFKE